MAHNGSFGHEQKEVDHLKYCLGPVIYCLQKPGKCQNKQLHHINLLKKSVRPAPVLSTFADVPSELPECTLVQKGEDLNPSNRQDLTEMVDQFTDMFSVFPGMTHLVQHEIKTNRSSGLTEALPHSRSPWDGISKESPSPKPNGSLRLCNDFLKLNQVLDLDSYLLP